MNRFLVKAASLLLALTLVGCSAGSSGSGSTPAGGGGGSSQPAAGSTSTSAGSTEGVTDTSIKVGAIVDMTGPSASISGTTMRGIKTYIDWVNSKGGVHGRTIELIIEDDRYTVPAHVAAMKKLTTQDKVFALIGQAGSSNTSAVSEDIMDLEIPSFGPQQTTGDQLENPFYFNLLSSTDDQVAILIEDAVATLKEQGVDQPRIAAVAIDVQSGYEMIEAVERELKARNLELAGKVLLPAATTTAAAEVQTLLEADVDWIVMHGIVGLAVAFLKDAHRYGLDVPITTMYSVVQPPVFEGAGPEATKNYRGVHSVMPGDADLPALKEMHEITAQFGDTKDTNSMYYVAGWLRGKLFVEVLERAGRDLTRESFTKAAETLDNYDPDGLSAPVTFANGNRDGIRGVRFFTYDFETKKMVALSDWIQPK